MIWIRSFLFQVFFFASVTFASLMIALCVLFPFRVRFFFAHWWGRSMLWVGDWLCGLKYSIEGRENIPDTASVILIKHSTVFETYAQLAVFPPQTWVLKRELKWIPIFGWGVAAMKTIAIDRGAGRTAVTQVVEQGKQRLADGIWVTVFPEGTRVPVGQSKKYGISGVALAKDAGVLILPVAHNAGDLWARRGFLKKPGLIRFVIGKPIDPSGHTLRECNEIVRDWIDRTVTEISAPPDAER